MNEPASDVDRRAEKTFNPEGLKTDCSADRINYRIDRTHFMKLDVFGSNVMNLAFGNSKLRENVRSYLLRLRCQLAFTNHCQNLRCLSMKVPRIIVMVFMFVLMFVVRTMPRPMLMGVFMVLMIDTRLWLTVDQHIKFNRADVRPGDT